MCIGSSPKIPAAVAQPAVQDVKQPTTSTQTSDRRKAAGIAGGSLLTGPSGVAINTANVGGANSFLGT